MFGIAGRNGSLVEDFEGEGFDVGCKIINKSLQLVEEFLLVDLCAIERDRKIRDFDRHVVHVVRHQLVIGEREGEDDVAKSRKVGDVKDCRSSHRISSGNKSPVSDTFYRHTIQRSDGMNGTLRSTSTSISAVVVLHE